MLEATVKPGPAIVRTDAEILQDVLREMEWDTRVHAGELGVQVHGGLVTLTGAVPNYSQKLAATRAAHRVRGVLDVADEIDVRYGGRETPTDTEVAEAVRRALEWDVFVDDRKLQSTVSEGFVTLEGEVDYLSQREEADRAVRRLKGVRGLLNKIRVRPVRADSDALRRRIEETLERRASREADRIQVEVEDGLVTLTGRVHSWQERDSVVGAVAHGPGVQDVRDHLRVDPWF